MKTTSQYIALLQEHIQDFKQKFGITSLRIFGSVARGEQHEGSDVDVFVEMPCSMIKVCGAQLYLEELLGTHVDLVRKHRNLSDFFLQQIEKDGVRIF